MKISNKIIAVFVAAAIWADESCDEEEKAAVEEIAKALDLEGLEADVDAELAKLAAMDGQAVADYLVEAGKGVDDEAAAFIFEAVLQVVLCDGFLAYSEARNLLTVADALGLEHEYALLMVADMMKEENDVEVAFE